MSNKAKISAPASKTANKTKRPSTANVATSSRTKIVSKDKIIARPKKFNTTLANPDADATFLNKEHQGFPDFDAEHRQIAYGKFLRAMLEECLIDEKIEREETIMDLQMAQLADRFMKTMEQLDKTNRRLKDISFAVEQKRLLDLKTNEAAQFYEITEKLDSVALLQDLSITEQAHINKLELNNVDFGYDKKSGHKQLLDAVNDAIDGLDKIKRESNLDLDKFKQYETSQKVIEDIEKDKFDLDSLKSDFESKFPQLSERLLKEASERIAKMIENDENDDGEVDGEDD